MIDTQTKDMETADFMAQSDLYATLISTLENTMRQTEINVTGRIQHLERILMANLDSVRQDLSDVRKTLSDFDRQIILINERQNKVLEVNQDLKELEESINTGLSVHISRIVAVEQDISYFKKVLHFIKWVVGLLATSGVLGGLYMYLINRNY